MAFDWKEYFNLALSLQGKTKKYTQQASFRSAVSRAYYAAFCYSRNYARDEHGFEPAYTSDDHYSVREHFQDWQMVNITNSLLQLRQWRNDCDYEDTISNVSRLCTDAIKQAQKIFDALEPTMSLDESTQ